jgi:hypothetical protein
LGAARVETEDVGEAGRLDDADDARDRATELEAAAQGLEALLRLHQQAEARGIDELERGQIDDDRIACFLREIAEHRSQRGGRSELELAADRDDCSSVVARHLDGERGRTLGTHAASVPPVRRGSLPTGPG